MLIDTNLPYKIKSAWNTKEMQSFENLCGKENTIEWSRPRRVLDRHIKAYLEDRLKETDKDYGAHLIMMTNTEDVKDYLDEEALWREQHRVTAE